MRELFASLLVPIALGIWVRSRNPERVDQLVPRLQRLVFLAIGILTGIAIAASPTNAPIAFEGAGRAAIGAGLWTLCAGAIGWGLGSALRLSADDRFTFAIEFSARNLAVAAIVAMAGLERLDLTLFSMLYGAVGFPIVIAAVIARRRWLARRAKADGPVRAEIVADIVKEGSKGEPPHMP
jgi:predicted Na+-dependent transporter